MSGPGQAPQPSPPDLEPAPREPTLQELVGHLTALLFVSDQPLEVGSVARILEARPGLVQQAIDSLMEQPPAGLLLQRQGSLLQLVTAPDSAAFVRRLSGQGEMQRLSRAALEVLSVLAYRQPVTRAEIEAVRGVNSDHVLETLLARGLAEEVGRRDSLGRPILFGTTLEFLRLAGLRTLDQLPPFPGRSMPASDATDLPPPDGESSPPASHS